MYRRDGNYMSLDPETAMRGVWSDMTDQELIAVAFNARCGVARRIALVRLRDPRMMVSFAKEDPDPLVRRGLVRYLADRSVLEEIAEKDGDGFVRQVAADTLARLEE
jgi:hypothetical protein